MTEPREEVTEGVHQSTGNQFNLMITLTPSGGMTPGIKRINKNIKVRDFMTISGLLPVFLLKFRLAWAGLGNHKVR